jgi:hypothetical protein
VFDAGATSNQNTLTAADVINGGAGKDALSVTLDAGSAGALPGAQYSNVENFFIGNVSGVSPANTFNFATVNGEEQVWNDRVAADRKMTPIPTSKTGKARHVPLSVALLSVLAQLPRWKDCSYVVPNPKTKQPYVSVFCSWNTARKQAGLPEVRMHDLRHSMASNMVNSGRSILEASKVLGHTELKTSQRYSHLSHETLLAAVDASANATGIDWGPAQKAKAGENSGVGWR